jgi:hypothetical protein
MLKWQAGLGSYFCENYGNYELLLKPLGNRQVGGAAEVAGALAGLLLAVKSVV